MADLTDEKDDFWDLGKLVPKKRSALSPFATKPRVTDVEIPEKEPSPDASDRTLTFSQNPEARLEESVYTPGWNPLIRSVKITRRIDRFDFYENFRKAALLYFDYKTQKCDFVPFYSYMPQYSQLTAAQKDYYFFWRDEVRKKRYLRSDYSYIYLYVYEILNLPDKISAEEGLSLLCEIYRAYRKDLSRLDNYFSIWIEDYCLVHALPCPSEAISDFLSDVIALAPLKEFYLADAVSRGAEGALTLAAYLSDYDWRAGKYAGGESGEVYRTHVAGALAALFSALRLSDLSGSAKTETLSRAAFPNSLCTHSVKCHLEITYIPLSAASGLREAVTAAVRYTENRLRAFLGVKSRLAIKGLPENYRAILDGYFDAAFRKVMRERERAAMPEYEKRYDAPREALSFSGADEIERLSWSNTARLVTEEYEEEIPQEKVEHPENNAVSAPPVPLTESKQAEELPEYFYAFLRSALDRNGKEQSRIASSLSTIADAIADEINDAFLSIEPFSDVVLESDGDAFSVIPDYEQEIISWLKTK